MTEYITVEEILSKNTENSGNNQAVSRQSNNSSAEEAKDKDDQNMARISWACCRKGSWFVVDGLGITCAFVTYGLIVYAEFVVVGVILLTDFPTSPWAYFHAILFTFMAMMAVLAHARSMTSDPVSVKNFYSFTFLMA